MEKQLKKKGKIKSDMKQGQKRDTFEFLLLTAPHVILTFIFCYLPMVGIILAFKNFNPNLGIFGSQWCGFNNFKFFFESSAFGLLMRNTILYGIDFLVVNNVIAVMIAVLLYNVRSRAALKYYQTTMILPNFMSIVLIAFIVYAILNPASGILNKIVVAMGGEEIDVYSEPLYWPFILTVVEAWKTVGMKSIIYYAGLVGIDESLFEAARIDGAKKWHEVRYIMIPEIMGLVCIYLILGIGGLLSGDFGLFYQIPMDIGLLYPTTDIISTYVFRALQKSTNLGATTAIGLFQSLAGLILIMLSNGVIKKVAPEKSLF